MRPIKLEVLIMKKTALSLAAAFTLTTGFFANSGEAAQYKVQSGDTLWNLSMAYHTTVEKIQEDNNLSTSIIYPDDVLEVNPTTLGEIKNTAKELTYKVQPGDTLAKIATAYGVTITDLVGWNELPSKDVIYAGDTLALAEEAKGQAKISQVTQTKVAVSAQTTKKSTSQTTVSQPTENVSRTLTMEATAYTAYCTGCSGVTANGTNLRANPNAKVVAVDPRVIPLGTKVWVEGYGEAIAADTGGAIKGNKIDVFIPTNEQAYAWGRKTVTVKVLN